jgi:L-glyceraldehyde 3-phosphate reductase
VTFSNARYDTMQYRRCGRSGLLLPAISLGMWHNFGTSANHDTARAMMRRAFDLGITHFDLANNYGPAPGSAEERVGQILKSDFGSHRDELIISTKAGYRMWPGPYGEWGSKKYLVASLDQSLRRLGLEYVDVFYSHRPDPDTSLEETIGALDQIVRQGKALYAGVSNYRGERFSETMRLVQERGWTPVTLHQPVYNLRNRWIEPELLPETGKHGVGVICFSPLAQGVLTNKYLDPANPLPTESRAADPEGYLRADQVTPEVVEQVRGLEPIARARGQSIAQLALAWVLRDPRVTSALIGARNVRQVEDCVAALDNLDFSQQELEQIDTLFPVA